MKEEFVVTEVADVAQVGDTLGGTWMTNVLYKVKNTSSNQEKYWWTNYL